MTGFGELVADVINLRALSRSVHAGKTEQDVWAVL
jgi:hypothetical protein